MNLTQSIAKSLAEAGEATEQRRARISSLLARHADGFTVSKWSKVTLAGDVFWTNGKKHITSAALLETLGSKLISAGALSESEYYC